MDNISNEEHERLISISEHAIAQPLSPVAQAVLDAVKHYETNHWCHINEIVAIILRVIAEQIQPGRNPLDDSDAAAGVHAAHEAISKYLLTIADELEDQ